ncbi:MAG: CARDB domain-containing protein [Bacteroidota bacterium]
MKNLLLILCLFSIIQMSAQSDDYEWTEMDTTYTEMSDFEMPELPALADLSVSFYAPLQTKKNTYTFDIPIQNKGVLATKACELQLIHTWIDANGTKRQVRRVETVPALVPGQLYTLRIKIKDASFRELGHMVKNTFIYIDPSEMIAEQDEGNNIVRYVPGQFVSPEIMESSEEEEYYEVNY